MPPLGLRNFFPSSLPFLFPKQVQTGESERAWEGDHCHLCPMRRGSGKGRAPRESALRLDFSTQLVRGEVGEGSSEGGPPSGPTGFLQLHLTGSRPLPITPGPQRSSAFRSLSLSIHLGESKEVYLISKLKQGTYNPPPTLSLSPLQTVSPKAQQEECRGRRDQGKMIPKLATDTQPERSFLIRIPQCCPLPTAPSKPLAPPPHSHSHHPRQLAVGKSWDIHWSPVDHGPRLEPALGEKMVLTRQEGGQSQNQKLAPWRPLC